MASEPRSVSRKRARRGRGEGTIYFDEKKRLYVTQVSLGYDHEGKRIRPTVYGKTKREVQEKLVQLQQDAQSGRPIAPANLTVKQHFKDWLRTKKPPATAQVTYARYERHTRLHIIPGLGRFKLRDVTYREINKFWELLDEKGLEPATVADIRNVLAMGMNDAVLKNIIPSSPLQLAVKRTPGKKEARFLTYDETEALLLAAEGERLADAWIVALDTGLRPGELFGLPWSAIDFRRRLLTVKQALHEEDGRLYLGPLKSEASYRTLVMSQETIDALQRQRRRQAEEAQKAKTLWRNTDGLVFTDTNGGYLRRTNVIRRDLRRVLDRAAVVKLAWRLGFDPQLLLDLYQRSGGGRVRPGMEVVIDGFPYTVDATDVLDGVVIHTFRHTHVSILLAAGMNVKDVAKRIGHEDPAFTYRKYAHCMPGQDEKAAEIMDQLHSERRLAVNRQ